MRGVSRALSIFALVAVLVLVGGLVQAAHVAPHDHGGPGLYDPGCPLAMLAAVERQGAVADASGGVPPVGVTSLAAVAVVQAPASAVALDLRFRAPPIR